MNQKLLKKKVAIVTGASSGLGKSIAFRYAQEGAIVIVASRSINKCDEVVNQIKVNGGIAIAHSCDVRVEEQVIDLFNRTELEFGKIDIVVANAGVCGGKKSFGDYTLEDWNRVIETNLTGVFLTAREAFRRMKDNGGHIIVMSSQAGIEGYADKGPYCASKFGVRGLAHSLLEEGRKYNINVSTLCPGSVDTPILASSNTRIKYPMSPNSVSEAAVFLACLNGNSIIRDIVIERMLLD